MENGAKGMGTVERGIHIVPPMIFLTVGNTGPDRLTVVDVLTLAVLKFTDPSGLIELLHLVGSSHKTAVFSVGIDFPGRLNGLDQFNRFLHVLDRKQLRENMLAGLQRTDCKGCMLIGIVSQNHRIHVMPDKFIKIIIERNIQAFRVLSLEFQRVDTFVADRDQFRVFRMLAITDHAGAAISTQHADPSFFHIGGLLIDYF